MQFVPTAEFDCIGCHGNRKSKFANKFSKIISTETIVGLKLKLCRNVHNISLFKSTFLVNVALVFPLLWQLSFHLTYNGKRENWPLLQSHFRYFDKSFTEMFLE